MNPDIWTYIAGCIFLTFVGMFAYYSARNAKTMRDSPGRKYLAIGAAIFVFSGIIDGVAMFIISNSVLRLISFVLWLIAICMLIYSGLLIGKAIQKVYSGSLPEILWEHPGSMYKLIGISVLVLIGTPIYIMDLVYTPPGEFSWLFFVNIVISAFCFANLALASRVYLSSDVRNGSGGTAELPARSGVLAVKAYGALTNTFLLAMKSSSSVFEETLEEYFEHNPILFEDCKIIADGTIGINSIVKNVDRIYKEDRVQDICTIFSGLSSKLLNLYGAVTSHKHAEELMTKSYMATQEIYGRSPILFDILRSLPEGALQRERIALLPRKELEARVRERTRELAESRSYINNIVNSMTDILIAADLDGMIKTVNKAAVELLGYDENELIGQALDTVLTPEEAAKFKGAGFSELAAKGAVRGVEKIYLTKDGSEIPVLSSDSVMHDDKGDIQGTVCVAQDITERKLAEEKEKRYVYGLTFLSETAMSFVKFPPEDDIHHFIGQKLWELVGHPIAITSYDKLAEHFHARALLGFGKGFSILTKLLEKTPIGMSVRMESTAKERLARESLAKFDADLHELSSGMIPKKISDAVKRSLSVGAIYVGGFFAEGELFGSVAIIMPEGVELPNREIIETFINQAAVALRRRQAEERIKTSLAEKEVLLKEIHHRVKNNLQVISSLLNLQSGYISDISALQMFKESQNRVRSMSLIHEKLYQSKDLARIDFAEYIKDLANYLFRMYRRQAYNAKIRIDAEDVSLDIDTAIPCGLIVNELISNSLKYAFPTENEASVKRRESEGEIGVELRSNDDHLMLIVSDNGIGLPEDLDFRETESLGLQLVNTLTEQLEGNIELIRKGGTTFKITFKKPKNEKGG